MRLQEPLLKLPIRFDADALAQEVRTLSPTAWDPHPTGFAGNEAVRLVSPNGQPTDALRGAMAPTEHLLRSPCMMQVMRELGGVWGRSRLMALAAGAQVPPHVDCHYYWRTHLRIHVPVVTNPGVLFTCGPETVHMQAGECWVFDSFQRHEVHNNGTERRIHLVLDTCGGERLWDLIEAAHQVPRPVPTNVPLAGGAEAPLLFERFNAPKVMSPWEMQGHLSFLVEQLKSPALAQPVLRQMDRFIYAWGAAWARYESADEGLPIYREMVADIRRELSRTDGSAIELRNNVKLQFAIEQLILLNAIERPPAAKLVAASGQRPGRLAS